MPLYIYTNNQVGQSYYNMSNNQAWHIWVNEEVEVEDRITSMSLEVSSSVGYSSKIKNVSK